MALPTKLKTWQYANNLNPSLYGTDKKSATGAFILAKDALKAFSLNPWTCVGSSDGTTAALDAVDRLVDDTDFVTSGTWIVLQQDAVSATAQLCFYWNSSDFKQVTVVYSPVDGFTGGTTGARPTATDEQSFGLIDLFWQTNTNGYGFENRTHVQMSTDGKCTRIFFCCSKEVRSWILIDVPLETPTGWTDPSIAICMGNTGSTVPQENLSFYRWNNAAYIKARGPIGDMPMFMSTDNGLSTTGTDSVSMLGYDYWPGPAELSPDDFPFASIGILHRFNEGTVGQRGWHGYIADMWATTRGVSNGNSFPGDGSKDWINFGNFAFPWDGGDIEIP